MKQTNYLTDNDPTLSQTSWAIIIMWAVTISIIVSMFAHTPTVINPPVEDANGYMLHSDYIWGQIK